eukprot:g32816.t1
MVKAFAVRTGGRLLAACSLGLDLTVAALCEQIAGAGTEQIARRIPPPRPQGALVQIPLAGSADTKVSQLAERVSVLVASMQKRCDEDKEELEQQMEKIHARLEARLGALERGEEQHFPIESIRTGTRGHTKSGQRFVA